MNEIVSEHLFEKIWSDLSNAIDSFEDNESQRHFLKAIVMGATVVAEMVTNNCQSLSRYWGKGDKFKASGLTRLFFFILLGKCYHLVDKEQSEKQSESISFEKVGRKLSPIFDNMTGNDFKLYLDLDIQFRYDVKNQAHLTHFYSLLLAQSCEICGHKCVELSKIRFPVK